MQKVVIVPEKVAAKTFKEVFKDGKIIRIFPGSLIDADNSADWTPNEILLSERTRFRLYDKG